MLSIEAYLHAVPGAFIRPLAVNRLWVLPAMCLALMACGTNPVEAPLSPVDTPVSGNETAPTQEESDPQEDIASAVPDTDIFVFRIDPDSPGLIVSFDANVTNRAGYDNQPGYLPDSNNFVFASILDGRQSDVYEYQESTGELIRRTNTDLSEYSPTPLPRGGFSSVVVEADGTQRLWRFTPVGRPLAPIRADVTGVGYHAWLPSDQLALFIVDEPLMHLDVVGVTDTSRYALAINPGRSLHARPGTDSLSFVQHFEGEAARLMNWDGAKVETLVSMPEGVEDMTWLPDGRALTVAEGRLLVWVPGSNSWQALYDMSRYLPGEVTRLAVNDAATRLAIVSSMTPPVPVE